MRVTRFMSRGEFGKLMAGEKLTNTTVHKKRGAYSESVGFCFTEDEPMTAFEYLYGIVDADVWVTFDFPDGYLTESGGLYADHSEGAKVGDLVVKREWCCTEYSLDIASVIKMDANFKYDGHQQINSAVDAFLGMYEAIVELEQKTGLKLL